LPIRAPVWYAALPLVSFGMLTALMALRIPRTKQINPAIFMAVSLFDPAAGAQIH
jgi:hypothetical protein